jgi:hypothetical protein
MKRIPNRIEQHRHERQPLELLDQPAKLDLAGAQRRIIRLPQIAGH